MSTTVFRKENAPQQQERHKNVAKGQFLHVNTVRPSKFILFRLEKEHEQLNIKH